jgi:putative transposase
VRFVVECFGLSVRRGCRLLGMARASFGYRAKRKPDEDSIRKRLRELAQGRRRFGCPRLHVMLRRDGFVINHKRTERLYRAEGLSLRIRRRRKISSLLRMELPKPTHRNHIWSMDFVLDSLANGRRLRTLPILDEYMRWCHRIEVDTSINGARVARVLDEIGEREGLPEIILIDNGPEFIGEALDSWAYKRGIKLRFITPGKPVENAYIESFNGRFRDECLNEHWFLSVEHARQQIEAWRVDYNCHRPHSSLGYLTPEEFIKQEEMRNCGETELRNLTIEPLHSSP